MSRRLCARELIDQIVDAGTWTSWDTPAWDPPGASAAYAAELARADLTLAGTLAGVQMSLREAGVKVDPAGLQAALDRLEQA